MSLYGKCRNRATELSLVPVSYFILSAIVLYSSRMIRTRRVLSFSARVYTYILLFNLFFYALFLMRLLMNVTAEFAQITQVLCLTSSTIGILYGLYLLLLVIGLLFHDHIFLVRAAVFSLVKILIHIFILISAQFIIHITETGIILTM